MDKSTWLYPAGRAFGLTDGQILNLRLREIKRLIDETLHGRGIEPKAAYVDNYRPAEVAVLSFDTTVACGVGMVTWCRRTPSLTPPPSRVVRDAGSNMLIVRDHPYLPFRGQIAQALGRYVYWGKLNDLEVRLRAHEYIHLLQQEGGGAAFSAAYISRYLRHGLSQGLSNRYERAAYLYQGWLENYPMEVPPWRIWKPVWAPRR